MTPGMLSRRVISDRLSWIERMVNEIRQLPWFTFITSRTG